MKNHYPLFFSILFLILGDFTFCQEPKIFTVNDFDLNGKVKSCTVITDYGKEIFEFDEEGLLVKSVTQYNEMDQDITRYKYRNGQLLEKRMESYKNNQLDMATSMVNFYEIDTVGSKTITEKIISYDKEFIEGQQYKFYDNEMLKSITTSHLDAIDETTIEYSSYKNEATQTFFRNGTIEKSIRTSSRYTKTGDTLKLVLTKEFIDGLPNKAMEQTVDTGDRVLNKTFFSYSDEEKQFVPVEKRDFEYDETGVLKKMITTRDTKLSENEFVYQFDGTEDKNWVKKIITPENSYTTRKITYYPIGLLEEDEQ